MAAGAVQLPILDGTATSRNMLEWSSTGLIGGNLSPLQAILGADGLNIASSGNGFPITVENVASGAIAAGAVAAGAFVSGSVLSGAIATGAIVDLATAQGGAIAGIKGPLVMDITTGAPTYTTAQTSPLSLDTAGNLRVVGSFSAVTASLKVNQVSIGVTGTQVQLASNALTNGVTLKAAPTNISPITVGLTGVTATADGTGNGHILWPGDTVRLQVNNTNVIFINGTAADFIAFAGN